MLQGRGRRLFPGFASYRDPVYLHTIRVVVGGFFRVLPPTATLKNHGLYRVAVGGFFHGFASYRDPVGINIYRVAVGGFSRVLPPTATLIRVLLYRVAVGGFFTVLPPTATLYIPRYSGSR